MHRDELVKLKSEIRSAIVEDWRARLPGISSLLDASSPASGELKKTGSIFAFVNSFRNKADLAAVWGNEVGKTSSPSNHSGILRRWDLSKASDHRQWFSYGSGTTDRSSRSGEFAIHDAGKQIVRGIYPAGVYSHLVSDKHPAVLTSPNVHLDGEYELWLQINGGGTAISRFVVQDYPRSGTVFPVTELKDDRAGQWR